jgi:Holliday junction resolvase-like predicted endonuclease
VLHFIAVKTSRRKKSGEPEQSVDNKKIMNLMNAGTEFQEQYRQWKGVQYNVVSAFIAPDGGAEYFFIEDIYL